MIGLWQTCICCRRPYQVYMEESISHYSKLCQGCRKAIEDRAKSIKPCNQAVIKGQNATGRLTTSYPNLQNYPIRPKKSTSDSDV